MFRMCGPRMMAGSGGMVSRPELGARNAERGWPRMESSIVLVACGGLALHCSK